MNLLKSLISPKLVIGIIRNDLQKKSQKTLTEFDINYDGNEIYIVIENDHFTLENDMLKTEVKKALNDILKKDEKFIFLKLHILADNSAAAKVYYIDAENNKKCITKNF
jgi:hypothetical protein